MGAAARNLDGMSEHLRQIAEQLDHLGPAFEVVFGRELTAVAFCEQTPFGNADQRIVRFVILHVREEGLIGGHQRHAFVVGEVDQRRLAVAFCRCSVPLQFHVEPVAKEPEQRVKAISREMTLPGGDCCIERTTWTACERDDFRRLPFQPFEP